jgi:hypothetical protein
MDIYEITQIMAVVTTGLVFARLGLALARRVERRPADPAAPAAVGDERLRALEDECVVLRRELSELQERQDFTERLLLRGSQQVPAPEKRVLTPR